MKSLSIGKQTAIKLYKSKWWENLPNRDIATFQMFINELCLPFATFHKAMEQTLGRPIFTHEFGLNPEGLRSELLGKKKAPSFQEIIDLIPANKRILINRR